MGTRRFLPDFQNTSLPVYDFDVIIVGTGIAGLYAALNLDSRFECAIVTKANIDESNSYLAQGGIAAVMTKEDNYVNHIEDTLKAGAGLCDPKAVRVLCEEGPDDIHRLIHMNVPFDVNSEGDLQITREGGHHMRRIVHCGGDATGRETTKQLGNLALTKENLHFFFDSYLVDLITEEGAAYGVLIHTGDEYKILRSNHIVLATGGIGQIYRYTTNPLGAVGDGIAAAYRAGACVKDMELIQFHPTTLISPEKSERLFLISEAVRGEGGILRNAHGEAFMQGKHELADLAPRDIVTRCILDDLARTGDTNVFLDVSMLTEEFFSTRFPTIYNECKSRGINLPKDLIPVRPAQHYLMGGIKSDIDGRTSIPGLYCCGECAETGIHGGNRLASNSLLECLVFGRRSVEHIAANFRPVEPEVHSYTITSETHTGHLSMEFCHATEQEIKTMMTDKVSAVRHPKELQQVKDRLDTLQAEVEKAQLNLPYEFKIFNMLSNARLIVEGAIARKTSVGAHYIVKD